MKAINNKLVKIYSWLFLSTGIFAIAGALYTWGEGPLFSQDDLLITLVPWADLIIAGPFSLFAAYGVEKRKPWGYMLGLMICGIYLFGSALVYISLLWNGPPYALHLALPPLVGIAIGISFPIWVLKNPEVWLTSLEIVSKRILLNKKQIQSPSSYTL